MREYKQFDLKEKKLHTFSSKNVMRKNKVYSCFHRSTISVGLFPFQNSDKTYLL